MLFIHINFDFKLDFNRLIDQLKKHPVLPQDLQINVAEKIKVSEQVSVDVSSIKPSGSLGIIKKTNTPSPKELQLIQAARQNRPYNSISDVNIEYDENGNITSLQWAES